MSHGVCAAHARRRSSSVVVRASCVRAQMCDVAWRLVSIFSTQLRRRTTTDGGVLAAHARARASDASDRIGLQ